ncbi:MAG: hypothetical protein WD801_13145 [Gemmatimonadaceae bacterium]
MGALAGRLGTATPAQRERADALARRLAAFQRATAERGVLIEDVAISVRRRDGVRFAAREAWIVAVAAPFATWGWLNHWLPFHAARIIAMRSVQSAADPAMRTIVAGAALVALAYAAQGIAVGALFGWVSAAFYLVSLPLAAEANFFLRERLDRARRRAKAYLLFRQEPGVRNALTAELAALRGETLALDEELRAPSV